MQHNEKAPAAARPDGAGDGTETIDGGFTLSISPKPAAVNPLAEARRLFERAEAVKPCDYAAYWRLRGAALLLQVEALEVRA